MSEDVTRSDEAESNETESTNKSYERATLAGGCFWCIEAQYDGVNGVKKAVSGYAGGSEDNATYSAVSTGDTDHREAVQVTYDPDVISYRELLDKFWTSIDPTDPDGQFSDRGPQYTTAIYYHDDEQRRVAEQTKQDIAEGDRFDEPIVTEIEPYTTFFNAEEEHQDYAEKQETRYERYKVASGREGFVEENWADNDSKPSKDELSTMEWYVTQKNGTEPPYANQYYDHDEPGIYVDVVSGEPLYSSTHKFDSGTGWPSFYKALEPGNVVRKEDNGLFSTRTEVRSKHADSHLGHVFQDGPEPTGERHCINSAALEFIHRDDLASEGYEEYESLFNESS